MGKGRGKEGWKRGGEEIEMGKSIFEVLPLFWHMMPREQQLVGHNIVQGLIHISMAPLGATPILYTEKEHLGLV